VTQGSATTLKSRIASFGQREEGTVAMVFGIAMLPFLMSVALSVDYGRSVHMSQKFGSALDAATLAAAKLVKEGVLTDEEIKGRAFAFFKENVKDTYAQYNDDEFNITIDRANSRIAINLPVSVPTTFARIGGFETMSIPQASSAVFALRDIEVGLALDVTGSMLDPIRGGGTKIDSLKSAFTKFANLMLPDNLPLGQKVRLGLAPYASGVNVGTFANVASGGASTDGCVVERTSTAAAFTDLAPSGADRFEVASPASVDIDNVQGRQGYVCPGDRLLPMSSDRDALIASVNSYNPNRRATTGGHFGVQWAWNLISPEWNGVWDSSSVGSAYTDKKVIKAVILMTDGLFNVAYNNGQPSAAQAIRLCDNIKAKGVQVFTLGFGLGNSALDRDAKATLQACASPGPDYFVDAANETELDAAFASFAGKINALRLAD
jgi:Flp pilus assembly protein TadG